MTIGPLEYLVIGFQDDRFDGSIAKEIEKVVEAKIIRIVDLVFIAKDKQGTTAVVELDNTDDPRFAPFARMLDELRRLFTPEDLERISESLPPGTAGMVLLFEHQWAEDIKSAMAARGGFLVTRAVIPPEVLEELNSELEARDREPVSAA